MEQFVWIALAVGLILFGVLLGSVLESIKARMDKIEYQQEVNRQLLLQQPQTIVTNTAITAHREIEDTKQLLEYNDE